MRFTVPEDSRNNAKRRAAPDYSSTSVRLRLLSLVVLLGLVLIGMNEAGKPETWERLGFRSTPANASEDETVIAAVLIDPAHPGPEENPGPHPEQTLEFWNRLLRQTDQQNQQTLLTILQAIRGRDPLPDEYQTQASSLVAKIRAWFETYEKPSATDAQIQRFESTLSMLSGAAEGRTFDRDSGRQFIALQESLDRVAFDAVEDGTPLNRSDERLAWLRTWERLSSPATESFEDVSWIQLAAQPASYRGQPIRIRGEVRGMEKPGGNGDPARPYVVLWVKPQDSNQTPYCVYIKKLPDDFPQPQKSFQKISEPVVIEGIFFKIRTYLATTGTLEECPLILADHVRWQPAVAVGETSSWKPPIWLLTLFFIGMPIVAAWLAISVYRATGTAHRVAGGGNEIDVEHSLRALAGDTRIQTERDRVQQLSEHDPIDD